MCPKSASNPSEMSMALFAISCNAKPKATRGRGACRASIQTCFSAADKVFSGSLFCSCAKPSAASPNVPDTQISSPSLAPSRRSAVPIGSSPMICTLILSGPRVVSPPMRLMLNSSAQAKNPRENSANQASSIFGKAMASVAHFGVAPIAAMSETFTARDFQPTK